MTSVAVQEGYRPTSGVWAKREDETDVAFAAFVLYRDQTPPRSGPAIAKILGKSERLLAGWSAKHDWVERAAAYTDHLDRLVVAAHEEDLVARRRDLNRQIGETAEALHTAAMARLYGSQDPERPVAAIDLNELDHDDVIRWFDMGAKWGRASVGLPDVTGAQMITINDLQFIIRSVIGVAERRMIRADFEAFVRECRVLIQERLGG